MKRAIILSIISFFICGCVSVQTTDKKNGHEAIEILANEDGSFELYGNIYSLESLIKKLHREDADQGKAVVVKANGNVYLNELITIRKTLARNRIPNVTIVTQRNATSREIPQKH